jgi:hypothetical protein
MTAYKITSISVSTESVEPLRGIIEIDSAGSTNRFELNEELAHGLCSDLERFLTQAPRRAVNSIRCG